ncbi:MAG TPA: inositol 2-dehydrogenase [Acetobacteraceae bacterium]|nr:inositol 2-dehydrogenase [Acetobacteraceae bacterium]
MIGVAVLGAGRIGQIHARNVAANQRARLAGVVDVDRSAAERLATAVGCTAIDLDAAFAADAVMICTPTPTHAELIERAAAAGKPVFCEKPVDLGAERVRACLAAVERAGIALMVGFNRRFDPSFRSLHDRLRAGEIGRIELLSITSRDPAPPPPAYVASSGGLFRDMMIHDLDMARFLLNEEPIEVYAAASALVDPAIAAAGDVDTAIVVLRTASGAIAQISNSRRAAYGYDQRIEAHGATGMLRAGNATATTVERAGVGGFTTDPALPFFLERYAAAYQAELDTFLSAVLGQRPAVPGGADGLAALVLADAATASARSGHPVRVG